MEKGSHPERVPLALRDSHLPVPVREKGAGRRGVCMCVCLQGRGGTCFLSAPESQRAVKAALVTGRIYFSKNHSFL